MSARKSAPYTKKRPGNLHQKLIRLSYDPDFLNRMRWIFYMLAFMMLFLAFQVGDDWFVREFANYDWARSIGY